MCFLLAKSMVHHHFHDGDVNFHRHQEARP
jgi:hypothetical protein